MSKQISQKQKKILSSVFSMLSLFWLFNMIIGPISSFGLIRIKDIQYPPGDIFKIVNDNDGNFYYADGFYSRVQTFDKSGHFKNSWYIDASGGSFDITITENNLLKVITARNNMKYVFDKTGHLLQKNKTYSNIDFNRKIINLKSVIIPFYLWLFNPIVSIIYVLVGVIGYRLINKNTIKN